MLSSENRHGVHRHPWPWTIFLVCTIRVPQVRESWNLFPRAQSRPIITGRPKRCPIKTAQGQVAELRRRFGQLLLCIVPAVPLIPTLRTDLRLYGPVQASVSDLIWRFVMLASR